MKKLITTFVLLAACHSTTVTTTNSPVVLRGSQTGATDAATAIRGFLSAAKQADLQAMGALWGSAQGPARDMLPREELEKRELVMMCHLKHDRFDVLGDAPNPGGTRAVIVSLTLGDLTKSTNFQVVRAGNGRWYVQDVDLKPLQDFCSHRG
ncbi:MAG: hypothetical protein ACM37U_14145 [Gemmatimonas sp.]|nr:hypothetical protein [Gemmatimonadaceae bacterium]